MITGDHIDTASAIGRELGILDDTHHAITGAMLNEMDDEQFEKEIEHISVYAACTAGTQGAHRQHVEKEGLCHSHDRRRR